MKVYSFKLVIVFLIFNLFTTHAKTVDPIVKASVTRGPYLQMGTVDGITIRWRTDVATNSRVTCGITFGAYPIVANDDEVTTEHIVRINSLLANTKYYYTIGDSKTIFQSDKDNHFMTLPDKNATRKMRFVAFGDCGNNSKNQINVRNSTKAYLGSNDVDAMLLLGDNAYNEGKDSEYQTGFFNIYKDDLLKYWKLYPAPGNHDYGNSEDNSELRNLPYHSIFTVPKAGEMGGVASGVSNYYSFDIGNVHFVSLDTYGRDKATKLYDEGSAQAKWLIADLDANTKKWTVVYFHHPPYTKTSHNSDTESDLVAIRERLVRIFEEKGVDLVLSGHSHGYERSYLLKGYYNNYSKPIKEDAFNQKTHTATGNIQNAVYDGSENSCPYVYNSGKYNHGTVYSVTGCSGALGGTSSGYPHNCMYYSNETNGGSFYFEVEDNRLDAKFISYNNAEPTIPVVRDQFTILKDANKTNNINVRLNEPLTLTASWLGDYKWTNTSENKRAIKVSTESLGTKTYEVKDNFGCIKDVFNVTVKAALSTDEFENKDENVIFPNPATNTITIKGESGSYKYYGIKDIEGKIVQEGNMPNTNEIDISKLPSGVYFVSLQSESNTFIKKMIKK
jgi:hypothetical protein